MKEKEQWNNEKRHLKRKTEMFQLQRDLEVQQSPQDSCSTYQIAVQSDSGSLWKPLQEVKKRHAEMSDSLVIQDLFQEKSLI